MNANVLDMVKDYLKRNGYDGLYNARGDCACKLEDLAPCSELTEHCTAGYLQPCGCPCHGEGKHAWHICESQLKV